MTFRERILVAQAAKLAELEAEADRLYKRANRLEAQWLAVGAEARRQADAVWGDLLKVEDQIVALGGTL